jgi:signal transduction protein with GAF and PtsI domain
MMPEKEGHARNNPELMSEKIRAMLACPVILRGEVAGILYIIDDFRPRQFSERQKSSLNLLAGLIGVAIGSDGSIGGYSSDVHIKRRLLEIEYYLKLGKKS